jgi:hypothetical protein
MRKRTLKFVAGTTLAVGIALVAFTGVSMGVSDDGTVTGRNAQQPLGSQVHASPTDDVGVVGQQESGGGPGQGSAPGETPVAQAQAAPLPDTGQAAAGGDGASSLPFTGFLAISALLLGAGLLATGLVLRRRGAPSTA